jgi:hypothetical protein
MYNPNLMKFDGLSVHAAAGQLDAMRSIREKPVTHQSFNPTYTRHSRQVQWPTPDIQDPTLRSFMLAESYSEFYPVEGCQPSQMAMAASIVSMLNNIIDPNLVSAAGTMGSTVTMTDPPCHCCI